MACRPQRRVARTARLLAAGQPSWTDAPAAYRPLDAAALNGTLARRQPQRPVHVQKHERRQWLLLHAAAAYRLACQRNSCC